MGASTKLIVSLILGGLAILLHIVGLSTAYWFSGLNLNFGLWQICQENTCLSISEPLVGATLQATRAFAIIGLLLGVLGSVMTAIYMFVKQEMNFINAALGIAIAAGICCVIAAGIFGGDVDRVASGHQFLSWSFALTVVGGLIFIAQSVMIGVGKRSAE